MAGGMCGGGVYGRGHAWPGACVAWGMHGRRACMAGVCAWQGTCIAGETATVVGGMHPTGMHSCYFN